MYKYNNKINIDSIINNRFSVLLVFIIFLFSLVIFKISIVMITQQRKYTKTLQKLNYTEISGASSPRGRIYDRNYNIIVDNKSVKTIVYKKQKGTSNLEMIETAKLLVEHIDLDYSRLTERNIKEYLYVVDRDYCDSLVSLEEQEKVNQRKITSKELYELKLSRIDKSKLNLNDNDSKVAYLYYLMNKGYAYESKIIKSDVSDSEYAYVSENK